MRPSRTTLCPPTADGGPSSGRYRHEQNEPWHVRHYEAVSLEPERLGINAASFVDRCGVPVMSSSARGGLGASSTCRCRIDPMASSIDRGIYA
jgi:hypothetical protein